MQIIDIQDDGAFDIILDRVKREAVLLQLPTVYTLVAAPNQSGVEQLNQLKDRLSGKNYGTVMGDGESFLGQALEGALPTFFSSASRLERLRGAFVRTAFTASDFNSPVIRGGTHQSLILEGIHRDLFRQAEVVLSDSTDPELWGGRNVSSLLCTSANLSGDPLGSITDRVRAVEFARQRNVGLIVTCEMAQAGLGSYPIFELSPDSISVQREGPGLERLLNQIPARLKPAKAA
ncbi:MAG: hypothetical protein AAEJ04_05360 [Planctomycetota bacterium]